MIRRAYQFMRDATRRYFVAGMLAFAPIGITIWFVIWIVGLLDGFLPTIIGWWQGVPKQDVPIIPVLGSLFSLLVIFIGIILLGIIARHFLGGEFVRAWERLLGRVPVARSIYGAVKQLAEAIFQSSAQSRFRRVVLIEYPRKGIFAIAFTTGPAAAILARSVPPRSINCFVPTTPNPTSGFYLLIPEDEIIDVDLSVEDAFKLVMSAGLVAPSARTS